MDAKRQLVSTNDGRSVSFRFEDNSKIDHDCLTVRRLRPITSQDRTSGRDRNHRG
jgi:hypothetical protein